MSIVIFVHYLTELKVIRLFDKNQAAKRILHNLHLVGHSLDAHNVG